MIFRSGLTARGRGSVFLKPVQLAVCHSCSTASLYFRAFYAVPTSITAPDGTPVNAVRGFCDMLAGLVTRWCPDDFVISEGRREQNGIHGTTWQDGEVVNICRYSPRRLLRVVP
jgi:hypothetical protein